MGVLFNSKAAIDPDYMRKKKTVERRLGHEISREEFESHYLETGGGSRLSDTGTSIFDPVLTETVVSWFTAPNDSILDPFAGGSVRGLVSCALGRNYTGVDLRQEQIDANKEQAEAIKPDIMPVWICGDSKNIQDLAPGEYDFILTCPPYGNLEIYSDDPADISNMMDSEFDEAYTEILRKSAAMLKENRFACIVVGNYRDKKGYLRDLCGLTIRAMESAGARYYNDFVIVTPIGSLPIRAGKSFQATRKMGRTHQYCLCFVKGNPKKASERIGEIMLPDLEKLCEDDDAEA